MSKETWTAVDRYTTELLVKPDAALDAALRDSVKAGLPPINVSAPQGKLLNIFARMQDARRILEVGTLGGYSTIWLARGLKRGGRLITLELDSRHAEVARKNIARAGLARAVEIRLGDAHKTLPQMVSQREGPFDLVFIDADKPGNPQYFSWALKLARKGTVIVVDNVVRNGAVIDAESRDESVQGVRKLNDVIASEKRVAATTIQMVSSKGYDGFTVAIVTAD